MQTPSAPVVETRYGALAGFTDNDVHAWYGIPYAAPPVGNGRWRSPQPPARWEGLREATAFRLHAGKAASIARRWAAAIRASFLKIVSILTSGLRLTAQRRSR